MKTEKSIFILIALPLLAFAILMNYNVPSQQAELSSVGYLMDIKNYKSVVTDKISIDNKRIASFDEKFEVEKRGDGKVNELSVLKEKMNGMQVELNNYKENGLEGWKSFKRKFDRDLNELHQSLKVLTPEVSDSHHSNLNPGLMKP